MMQSAGQVDALQIDHFDPVFPNERITLLKKLLSHDQDGDIKDVMNLYNIQKNCEPCI